MKRHKHSTINCSIELSHKIPNSFGQLDILIQDKTKIFDFQFGMGKKQISFQVL